MVWIKTFRTPLSSSSSSSSGDDEFCEDTVEEAMEFLDLVVQMASQCKKVTRVMVIRDCGVAHERVND